MPRAKPELLCGICYSLLLAGINLSDPAGYVHCSRMAANESTFTSSSLSCYHTEIAVFCGVFSCRYQGCILHVTGKKSKVFLESLENTISSCLRGVSVRWKTFSHALFFVLNISIVIISYVYGKILIAGTEDNLH
jgi:hypothetical protein